MSSRLHARSKSPRAPRTFTAAKGLTVGTEVTARVAEPAESTGGAVATKPVGPTRPPRAARPAKPPKPPKPPRIGRTTAGQPAASVPPASSAPTTPAEPKPIKATATTPDVSEATGPSQAKGPATVPAEPKPARPTGHGNAESGWKARAAAVGTRMRTQRPVATARPTTGQVKPSSKPALPSASLPHVSLPHVSLPRVSLPRVSMPHLGRKPRPETRATSAKATGTQAPRARLSKSKATTGATGAKRPTAKATTARSTGTRKPATAKRWSPRVLVAWMPFVGSRPKGGAKAATAKETRTKKPPTSAVTRRRRIPVAVAALFALVLVATSFPFTALLSQHQQLAAASTELHQTLASNKALIEREHQLNSKAAIARLAREEYQLVSPGQTLYDVLPASGRAAIAPTAGLTSTGDPGTQALVAPADAPDLSPQPDLSSPTPVAVAAASAKATPVTAAAPHVSASTPTSFWGRVTDTLEFWK